MGPHVMSRPLVQRGFIGLAFFLGLLGGPTFAGMETLSDNDLDRVSAAGHCEEKSTIPCETSNGNSTSDGENASVPAFLSGQASQQLTLEQAQQGIRALAITNVSGMNQVANGMNIAGGGP